jgi:hypothetical protein
MVKEIDSFKEILILVIFIISLLANFCYAIFNRQMGKYTFRWDLFRWISAYQLFAETPTHLRLFYRDALENSELTNWKEIPLLANFKWYHYFFYYEKLTTEALFSFVDDLVKFQSIELKRQSILDSFAYKTVLKIVRQYPSFENSISRQFKIVESGGYVSTLETKELFTSEFHT